MDILNVPINDKRTIRGWAVFDWANSAYALVISTAVFPPYFTSVTPDQINILGYPIPNIAVMSYSISIAFFVVACMSPILSSIADVAAKRKMFLKIFTILGALSCMSLFFFTSDNVFIGIIGFILATIGYGGGVVFYNSYLPIIVSEDRYDKVSAKGFAYGYVGSVILLLFILFMVQKPEIFGIIDQSLPARIGFLLVGIWWIVFGYYSFRRLPDDLEGKIPKGILTMGFKELKQVFKKARLNKSIIGFLMAYFLFIGAVNTVIYLATPFAEKEIGFETAEMIILVLILQMVGVFGAYLFAWVSKVKSNKLAIMIMLIIWMLICVAAFLTQEKQQFFILAGFVGLVMGGIQSVSRSTYSKLVDQYKDDLTAFFSFFDVTTRIAIVTGTFVFGFVEMLTNDIRYSVLSLAVFFIFSILVFSRVKLE